MKDVRMRKHKQKPEAKNTNTKSAENIYQNQKKVTILKKQKTCDKIVCGRDKQKHVFILVRKYAKEIKTKITSKERVEVIEIDELYSFVKRKTKFT